MKITYISLGLLFFIAFIKTDAQDSTWKRTRGGLPYKIYEGEGTTESVNESYLKFHVKQILNDSVIFNSRQNALPLYQKVTGLIQPYDVSELFALKLKKGDSIVSVQLLDSFIRKNPALAERYKPTDKVFTYMQILDVFQTEETYKADEKAERDNHPFR